MTPKIYAFINSQLEDGSAMANALAEDGTLLVQAIASSVGEALFKVGVGSDWYSDVYADHYPNGYEIEHVSAPLQDHAGLMAAYAKHCAFPCADLARPS
jgi:hypothetical protein